MLRGAVFICAQIKIPQSAGFLFYSVGGVAGFLQTPSLVSSVPFGQVHKPLPSRTEPFHVPLDDTQLRFLVVKLVFTASSNHSFIFVDMSSFDTPLTLIHVLITDLHALIAALDGLAVLYEYDELYPYVVLFRFRHVTTSETHFSA